MEGKAKIAAVDLFCGAGGLTYGLSRSGVEVRLGVDLDPACCFPIEQNNNTKFMQADVAALSSDDIFSVFQGEETTLIAGCAPCQPFSTYSRSSQKKTRHRDWALLNVFSRLVLEVRPTLVTMENVPPLQNQPIFEAFVLALQRAGYYVDFSIMKGLSIGLPQRRKRLVLIASLLGPINIPNISREIVTVRDAISDLPSLKAGEVDPSDPLHCSASLSALNMRRIEHSTPGGTWRDWPKELMLACHSRGTGTTYSAVYGRMEWDQPAPTITTQCYGYGNGRFGHPEQNRAISLREAAILQGFPRDYAFVPAEEKINFNNIGRMIGNAVPVNLGEFIGQVLLEHVAIVNR